MESAGADEDAIARFEASARRPGRHVWLARRVLRPFLSDFALNGLLGTYPLHLLATEQWQALLGDRAGGSLLDLGAADGEVTSTLAPLFDRVAATDTARPMVRRLRQRGWTAECLDLATSPVPAWHEAFDTVALLNVLDRSNDGPRLLDAARWACAPGGTVLIALALPYDPWTYRGSMPVRPKHRFDLRGRSFEADAEHLVHGVLPKAGLAPLRWARTPYVSVGRPGEDLYRLDCAVVVCRRD